MKWTKTGGWTGSSLITYDSGLYQILRTRICGAWTRPSLYLDGGFLQGCMTVKEAKQAALEHSLVCTK